MESMAAPHPATSWGLPPGASFCFLVCLLPRCPSGTCQLLGPPPSSPQLRGAGAGSRLFRATQPVLCPGPRRACTDLRWPSSSPTQAPGSALPVSWVGRAWHVLADTLLYCAPFKTLLVLKTHVRSAPSWPRGVCREVACVHVAEQRAWSCSFLQNWEPGRPAPGPAPPVCLRDPGCSRLTSCEWKQQRLV